MTTSRAKKLPKAITERLRYLSQLEENWDGYDAPAISERTVKRASDVLLEILAIGSGQIPLPFISPSGDGMIVMEWKTEWGKELILDVPPGDDPLGFLLVEPTESGEELEIEGDVGEPLTLAEIIQRLSKR